MSSTHFVAWQQRPSLPVIGSEAYLSDLEGDVFRCPLRVSGCRVALAEAPSVEPFAINVRYNAPGYGHIFMTADNAGEGYRVHDLERAERVIEIELFRSRHARNERRLGILRERGYEPSGSVSLQIDWSRHALTRIADAATQDTSAELATFALGPACHLADQMELEAARLAIANAPPREFRFGCDARSYYQLEKELFLRRFSELFEHATITHYLIGDRVNFEEREGDYAFAQRDELVSDLRSRGIIIEGRPLFWAHTWVSPDWFLAKDYDGLLGYLDRHVPEVVGHYGEELAVWEVVNELHDWANELELTQDQAVEVTRHVCDLARATNPRIKLLVNNCCLSGVYVHRGVYSNRPATHPQRTPFQFVRDLVEADVDFDILGLQLYFNHRSPADTVQLAERFEQFGKTIHYAEVGAPSRGTTQERRSDRNDPSREPFEWRRHWDEALQADYAEHIFTHARSRPLVHAALWYDFADPHNYLSDGGLLREGSGEPKLAYQRLLALRDQWRRII